MNLKKQAKIATVLALSTQDLLIRPSMQAHIRQRDVNISGLFSKLSNLELVAFDKKEEDGSSMTKNGGPGDMEMLQLGKSDSASVKTFSLNGDELNEVMSETFTPPQEKEPSVEEILQKQDQEEKEQAKKQQAQSLVEQSSGSESQNTEEMTITEHMAHVKQETSQALEQMRKDKEEADRRKAQEAKKKEVERKKKEAMEKAKAKNDPKKNDEREMDEFVEKQLRKQREDRERYDREILGKEPEAQEQKPEEQAPKKNIDDIINQHKQSKDKEVSLDEESQTAERPKNSFKSADEALEHFGQSIAQRQLESQIKIDKEKEEQEQQLNSAEKAKQEAEEKRQREENEKKEREEKRRKEEEQRLFDDRKDRLLNKLHSFGGGGEETAAQPGFFEQAQKRMETEKNLREEAQDKQAEKDREKIAQAQQSQEEASAADAEAARKVRLQQKLESFQIAEEPAQNDAQADPANEKQLNATAEEIVNAKAPAPKPQPPAEESVQTVKEVHINSQMLDEINKSEQFTSLVDQVEKEQQAKAARVRVQQALREEKEKQRSLQDQRALQRELESEQAAQQQLAQQQLAVSSLAEAAANPLVAQSAPPAPEKVPSAPVASEKKFDIHQLIKDAVRHNKEQTVKPVAVQQKPARPAPSTPPPAKKPQKASAVQTPPAKAKPAATKQVKPVAKAVKKEAPAPALVMPSLVQQPAPAPVPATPPVAPSGSLLQTRQIMETKVPEPAEPEVSEERLNAKLQKEMAENGVKEPSDITKALIDDSTNEQLSGHGFFGKYLKKHRDMKKKAQEQLIREDLELKARKERLKKEMSEKIKADPVIQTPGGVVQKKKKKKTLSERAHQKLIDEENTKDAEAQEKAQMVVQVSQLAQLPNLGLEINLAPRSERAV